MSFAAALYLYPPVMYNMYPELPALKNKHALITVLFPNNYFVSYTLTKPFIMHLLSLIFQTY